MAQKSFAESIIVLLLVLTPLGVGTFFPRSMLGIPGLNPVNFIWLAALLVALGAVLSGRVNHGLREYFSFPFIILMLLYGIAFSRTLVNIDELTTYAGFEPNVVALIRGSLIKPLQIFLTGWIVLVACRKYGGDHFVYKAVLLSACVLSGVVLFVFLKYSVLAGAYRPGRTALSEIMGMHPNGIGALGVYFLFFGLMSRDKVGGLLRVAGVSAALLIIVLSFSRIGYLTTLVLFGFFYRKLPLRERRYAVAAFILVFLVFSAQIIQRVYWGFAEEGVGSGQTVDAGRIDGIWLPLVPQVKKSPVVGSGLYGMLKSDASRRGLHVTNPHSSYLQVLLDQGLVGLFMMLYVFGSIYFKARSSLPLMGYLVLVMMLEGLTGHTFYPEAQNYLWSVGYGLLIFTLTQSKVRKRKEMTG